jgi:hypothetical protein
MDSAEVPSKKMAMTRLGASCEARVPRLLDLRQSDESFGQEWKGHDDDREGGGRDTQGGETVCHPPRAAPDRVPVYDPSLNLFCFRKTPPEIGSSTTGKRKRKRREGRAKRKGNGEERVGGSGRLSGYGYGYLRCVRAFACAV